MKRVKLFVREFGKPDYPALIVMHGLFGMSDNWVSLAKVFAQKYYVLVPDLRNHGSSPHTDEFSYELMMEDVLGMMEDYSINKAVFLGHSMGGKLAMNLAAHYSEKVEKLIVADMSLREGEFKEIHAAIMDTIAKTDMGKFSSYAELEKYFDSFIDKKKVVLFALKNVKKNADGTFAWKLNYYSLYQNVHKIMEEVVPLDPFEKPTLFIRGEYSDYILDEDLEEIHTWFPQAQIETIPKASHWVHADDPKLFAQLVLGLLG
jgi:esterase